MRRSLFLLIILLDSSAHAICVAPELTDYARGSFKIASVVKAKMPCVNSNGYVASEIGPGCFWNLEQIGKSESDLSQERSIVYYAGTKGCNAHVGNIVQKSILAYCCPEFTDRPACGDSAPRETACFIDRVFSDTKNANKQIEEHRVMIAADKVRDKIAKEYNPKLEAEKLRKDNERLRKEAEQAYPRRAQPADSNTKKCPPYLCARQ